MALHAKSEHEILVRLHAQIARLQETVDMLKADDHICHDAERQLQNLKQTLALLR